LSNEDAADPGNVMTHTEGTPPSTEENLEPCAKIHGGCICRRADIPEVAYIVSRWNIQTSAEFKGEMG
jgi:hypothetical protein